MPCDDITQSKEVEFYSASVNAWYNTQLEHDKNLLTLSAGGIGLLITLISTVGVSSAAGLVLYVLALLCFVACVFYVLVIFKQNGKYIEVLVNGDVAPDNSVLQRFDSIAILTFAAGVFFAVVLGISSAITSYYNKEKCMTDENKSSFDKTDLIKSEPQLSQFITLEGFGEAYKLRPTTPKSSGTGDGTQQVQMNQSSSSQQGDDKNHQDGDKK